MTVSVIFDAFLFSPVVVFNQQLLTVGLRVFYRLFIDPLSNMSMFDVRC